MSLKEAGSRLELGSFFEPLFRMDGGIPSLNMFLFGRWVPPRSGRYIDVRTPVDGSIVSRAAAATKEEVAEAVAAASESRYKIRDVPAIERIEIFEEAKAIMQRHKGEFVRVLTAETGKPVRDAEGEVGATLDRMSLTMEDVRKIFGEYVPGDWSEDTMGKVAIVLREPIGVIAAISPFNYPLFIYASKVIPALLSGNAIVTKPASNNPTVALMFARVLEEAGIPEGTLQVVTGSGGEVGNALVADGRVGMVSFTGSTAVGKQISSLVGIKKQHLELGGKGAAIVLDDADLDLAAGRCVQGSLRNAGQRCDAVSVILVAEGIAEGFVRRVLERVDRWKAGDPRDPSTEMGPLIDIRAAERVKGLVDDAVAKGAECLRGGRHDGCYFEPTVLDRVPLAANIVWEETFGPVITVVRIRDEDEAIEIANRSKYGLDSCVFTRDFYRMWKVAKRIQTGEVTVNDLPKHGVGFFPYGGWKDSGVGREGIGYTIEEMTYLKTIVFNMEPAGLGKVRRGFRM